MNKNIDFVNGNTKKCLLEMTVPMIIAMFLNMAYNLVDSLWIGNLLGEQAYAALTNSTPIILILTSIGMGATNGLAILLSQVIGAKNEQKKKERPHAGREHTKRRGVQNIWRHLDIYIIPQKEQMFKG